MKNSTSFPRVLPVLALALAACSSSSDPTSPISGDAVAVTLSVQAHGFGTTAPAEANTIRVTARGNGGQALDSHTDAFSGAVEGSFGPYELTVSGNPVETGSVEVELFHGGAPDDVLWSGRVENVGLSGGESVSVGVDVYRGPLSNLDLVSIALIGLPSQMQAGTTTTLSASGSPSEVDPFPFWGSLEPDVAQVNGAGVLTTAEPGEARIIVAAGARSDTVTVTVTEGEPEPSEHGSSRTFARESEQWIEMTPAAQLSFPDAAWTFSVWVRPGQIEGEWFHYAVSSGDVFEGEGPGFHVYYGEEENVHHWHVSVNNDDGEGGHHVLSVPPRPTTGAWTHITVRYDGEGEVDAFVNGSFRDSFEFSGPVTLPDPINIGRRADGDEHRYLDGQIAHLARWDGALSNSQILDLARGMHPMAATGGTLDWFVPLGLDPEEGFGPTGETLGFELINGPTIGSSPPVSDPPSG